MAADNLIRLYDGSGRTITEMHPGFKERLRDINFSYGIGDSAPGYGGYNPDPSRRGWSGGMYKNAGSNSYQKERDRLAAMWDARQAARYTWIGGVIARLILYICGNIQVSPNTGNDGINEVYSDYFWGWAGDERSDEDGTTRCDYTGRARFPKQIQMGMFGFFVDGDYGMVEVDPRMSPNREFCIQGIQADRIGSPLECTTLENYIGGLTIDPPTGRIISYRIYRRTRTDQYVDKIEIPVSSFIHLIDPDQSDEYRCYSKLLPLLNDLRDIREWVEAEKIAGKTQAQWAAMVGLKDPFNNTGPMSWSGVNRHGTPYQDAEWGKILRMAEGENFSMLAPPSRPSGAFQGFAETVIRMMAVGLRISYGLMWDIATLGGATARIEVEGDERRIQYWQKMIRELVIERVYQKVIAQGIAQEALPPCQTWRECTVGFGKFITADIGYDMSADIDATTHGIKKVEDVTMKHGSTPAEVFKANARAFNTAINAGTEAGAPVETFAAGLYPNGTQLKASYLAGAPPPPPPMSAEATGDKIMDKVIDVVEKVGEGVIDRQSAIYLISTWFPNMPKIKIEKLIPEAPREPIAVATARATPAQVVHSGNGKNGAKKR